MNYIYVLIHITCIDNFYFQEASVLKFIEYRASMIGPTYYQWQTKLGSLIEHYYKNEIRTTIRVKILDILNNVIQVNRFD
jgi:hypothetical protein